MKWISELLNEMSLYYNLQAQNELTQRHMQKAQARHRASHLPRHLAQTWRGFPCFHADLPGFGFAFFVCDTEFFFARMDEKNVLGPFLAPNPLFLAQNVFF